MKKETLPEVLTHPGYSGFGSMMTGPGEPCLACGAGEYYHGYAHEDGETVLLCEGEQLTRKKDGSLSKTMVKRTKITPYICIETDDVRMDDPTPQMVRPRMEYIDGTLDIGIHGEVVSIDELINKLLAVRASTSRCGMDVIEVFRADISFVGRCIETEEEASSRAEEYLEEKRKKENWKVEVENYEKETLRQLLDKHGLPEDYGMEEKKLNKFGEEGHNRFCYKDHGGCICGLEK